MTDRMLSERPTGCVGMRSDGWRFRGRGLKQVTGRGNYRAYNEDHALMFGERIDFEAEPELLGTHHYAARRALWFWRANSLFSLADAKANDTAADTITAVVNPGSNSYGQRWENVRDLNSSGVFANVCRFSVSRPRFEATIRGRRLTHRPLYPVLILLLGDVTQSVGQTTYNGATVETPELRVELRPVGNDRFEIALIDKATGLREGHEFEGEGANDPSPFLLAHGRYCNTAVIMLNVQYPWRHDLPEFQRVISTFAFRISDFAFINVASAH